MRKIVITPRGFFNYGKAYIKELEDKGFVVDANGTGKSYTVEQFYEHCKDADALVVGVEQVDKAFMRQPIGPVSLMVNISSSATSTEQMIAAEGPRRKPPITIITSLGS